jgi:hypothetical protein
MNELVDTLYKFEFLLLGSIVMGIPFSFYIFYLMTVGRYRMGMEDVFRSEDLKTEFYVLKEIADTQVSACGGAVKFEEYDDFIDSFQEEMERCGYKLPKKKIKRAVSHSRVGSLSHTGIRRKDIDRLARYLAAEMWLYANTPKPKPKEHYEIGDEITRDAKWIFGFREGDLYELNGVQYYVVNGIVKKILG